MPGANGVDTVIAVTMPGADSEAEGAAAEAIRAAETALARQNSVTAQVDLQVVAAVLGAHAAHAGGAAALEALQADIEAAVTSRTALDTPAGAREFQRYLIDKLHDIRAVVEDVDLTDTSKAALAAALASLYATAGSAGPEPGGPAPVGPGAVPAAAAPPPATPGGMADPGLADFGPLEIPGPREIPGPLEIPGPDAAAAPVEAVPQAAAPAAAPQPMPSMPALPSLGGAMPGGGIPGLAPLGGLGALPGLAARTDRPDTPIEGETLDQETGEPSPPGPDTDPDPAVPDGDPPFNDVIAAAVAGTPIPEAFGQHGIAIPAPGSPVGAPLDPAAVIPGDVAMFDDRHALALGNGKVLLDDQIQPIETVDRPGFLGWQHPPPGPD